MKIIFMGTPDFAIPALKKLIDSHKNSKHEIIGVYTQKPKEAGRGQKITKSKIHQLAEENGLKVFTPDTLKSPEEQKTFSDLNADLAVVVAYGMLLPKQILDGTRYGCINIHPSLLPRWRGAAPLQRTIMAGDKKTAVCIMRMDEGLDTGDVIIKEEFDIPDNSNTGWLHLTCSEIGADLTLKAIDLIETGKATYTKQSEEGVTYARKIKKEDEKIDFSRTVEEVINQINGLSPFPGAYFSIDNIKYKIFRAEPLFYDRKKLNSIPLPGTITDNKFGIVCENGQIFPLEIQKEGKPRMNIDDFIRGNPVPMGRIVD